MDPRCLSDDEFDALIDRAIAEIPADLLSQLNNVAIFVEPDPREGEQGLLGLYHGVPLTERGSSYGAVLPDSIRIFKNPILRICQTNEQVVEQVRITVVHEIAHHFGIDDERLHELGYG